MPLRTSPFVFLQDGIEILLKAEMHLSAGGQLFDGKCNGANAQPDDKTLHRPIEQKNRGEFKHPGQFLAISPGLYVLRPFWR